MAADHAAHRMMGGKARFLIAERVDQRRVRMTFCRGLYVLATELHASESAITLATHQAGNIDQSICMNPNA